MRATLRAFLWRLVHLGRHSRSEASFDDELKGHVEMETDANLRLGMSPEEARRQALIAIGGLEQTREEHRDGLGFRLLQNLGQDLRYAFRTYRKNRGFVVVVVLTLTIGIGLNVAFFSIFNTFIWGVPSVRDPSRLVSVELNEAGKYYPLRPTYAQYLALRDNNRVFSGLAAETGATVVSPQGLLHVAIVSGNYFAVLGGSTVVGRPIAGEEDQAPGASPVVVLSHRAWQRLFHANPEVARTTVRLAGSSFTVIGVADPKFGGLGSEIPDMWVPLSMRTVLAPSTGSGAPSDVVVQVFGRLANGITLEQARAAASTIAGNLFSAENISGARLTSKATFQPIGTRLLTGMSPVLIAFALVLLIACANVANLLLSRSAARRREMAVRLSLGAARGRLVRQLLTESAVLALSGGLLALPFSRLVIYWVVTGALRTVPSMQGAQLVDIPLGFNVVLCAFLISLFAAVNFGLAPALESTRIDLASSVKDGGKTLLGRTHVSRSRNRQVVIQVAASMVLLIGTGLLLRVALQMAAFNPGFDARKVIRVSVTRKFRGERDAGSLPFLLAERLRGNPQIGGVSLSAKGLPTRATAEGRGESLSLEYSFVTPEFFQVLDTPLVCGRHFSESEIAAEAPVTIISERAAASFWPGQNPLGKHIGIPPYEGEKYWRNRYAQPGSVEVIGVSRNVSLQLSLGYEPPPGIYLPTRADNPANRWFFVRPSGDAKTAKDAIRREIAAIDPDAFPEIYTVKEGFGQMARAFGWVSQVAGLLAFTGLLLAVLGLAGLVSCSVSQSTHEIGIRIALGAQLRAVLWLIVKRGLQLTVAGMLIGLGLAAALVRVFTAMFYPLASFDLATFIIVPALLMTVCVLAAYIPARRATRLDPLVALRHE